MKKIIAIFLSVILIFTMTSISFFAEGAGPEIDGSAYVMINSETNQVLCGNEVEREVDPSSLTSLAIAYLYITRTSDLEKEITVNFNASDADVPGSISDMLGLRRNNTVTASDLLAAVFANAYPDAVRALAEDLYPENYAESTVEAINALFTEMGFSNTQFSNIYGEYDTEHYISVKEYASFIAEALKNETFRNYFTTPRDTITISGRTTTLSDSYMQREGDSYRYSYAIGGLDVEHLNSNSRSLAAAAEKDGVELVVIIINSGSEEELYEGAESLFEYGFNEFSYIALSPAAIPVREIDITENEEFAKIFYEHTIDIYLHNSIGTENLLYHIDVPEDFGKDNPTAYLEITQSQTDYQYEEIGRYPMTVTFETYNTIVPQPNETEGGGLSAIDIIIIVIIALLLAAIGVIFWFVFQKKKRNQRRARFRKIEKLQDRSLNPKDMREREEKENMRRGMSSVASEVENYGINEDYVEPPVIVETQRTGTRESIEAAKEAAKKKREEEIKEYERRISEEGKTERIERFGKQTLDRTYVTNEKGEKLSLEDIKNDFQKRAERSRELNKEKTFTKTITNEEGIILDKEDIAKLNTHSEKKISRPRTGTSESLENAKLRNEEARSDRNKKEIKQRTTILSDEGKTLDKKAVEAINDSSRQKKEPLERTILLNAEKRKAKPGELVIKEIKNPDGTVTKILAPDGE